MRSERFRILVQLAGGLISVQEAQETLYPSKPREWLRMAGRTLAWSGISLMSLLLVAGAVAEGNDWNPWVNLHVGFLCWNGPTVARHVHAVLWNLFGGLS